MLDKNNTYFAKIREIGEEHEQSRINWRETKERLANEYGYDSAEYQEWYKANAKPESPLSWGVCKAYRAWRQSIEREENILELDDSLWDCETNDFVTALREAGINEFIVTHQSTALMDDLHNLAEAGCIMEGLATRTRHENRWGEEAPYEVKGIRFRVN